MTKRAGDLENFELPVWHDVGARWYEKVNRLARKYKMRRADLLDEAVNLFERYQKTVALKKVGGKPATEEDIRKVFGGFAKAWWDALTPQQRAEEARKRRRAAQIRWERAKGKK